MEILEVINIIKSKADNCIDNTKDQRARKGAYVDCLVLLKKYFKTKIDYKDIEKEFVKGDWELEKEDRYFVDLRAGCAAIRDSWHKEYDEEYPGLHRDTPDVIEYIHGYKDEKKSSWEIHDIDVQYLNSKCKELNKTNNNHGRNIGNEKKSNKRA